MLFFPNASKKNKVNVLNIKLNNRNDLSFIEKMIKKVAYKAEKKTFFYLLFTTLAKNLNKNKSCFIIK